MTATEKLYHVTVLSNFARGFDKYSRLYCKERIPESTFPDRFFLLRQEELGIGVRKAKPLVEKLGLDGNRLIVLETEVESALLQPNTANGRGRFIVSNRITLNQLHDLESFDVEEIRLRPLAVEDAMAASLRLLNRDLIPFTAIRPRAISFLPVAIACQAKCPFCFSKASVSSDQTAAKPDWEKVGAWLNLARTHGAERAVITGGGEPTLLPEPSLQRLISTCADSFDKVVLITNGHTLASTKPDRVAKLGALYDAGLRVLAVSRHHFDEAQNERLMHLHTPVETLIQTWRENQTRWPLLRLRLISVLQRGGVEDDASVRSYVTWAADQGVKEICFKELYVSTSAESVYHDRAANDWGCRHQAPLSLVTRFAEQEGFIEESRLPWGAPVFRGEWRGQLLRIAAYTEPSLFWERTRGVARSWNVMADGRCHVSLEDRASEIKLEEAA
jgi:molybdenum cofactor biosynthesis enzyme MoaA